METISCEIKFVLLRSFPNWGWRNNYVTIRIEEKSLIFRQAKGQQISGK
jgi:hypothetical protein